MQCTRFKSLRNTKPETVTNLLSVLDEIQRGTYKTQVEEIRKAENPSKSPLKDKLPVFTPTGVFNYRSMAGLEQYNGLIVLISMELQILKILKKNAKTYIGYMPLLLHHPAKV